MNPVPLMKLVEVIRAIQTNDDTFKTVFELSEKLGKTPVEVNDYPGLCSQQNTNAYDQRSYLHSNGGCS